MERHYYEILESDNPDYQENDIGIYSDGPSTYTDDTVTPGDTLTVHHDEDDAMVTYRYLGSVEFDSPQDYINADTDEIVETLYQQINDDEA